MEYNAKFHCRWDIEQYRQTGKWLAVYCRSRAIEIKKRYANGGSYDTAGSYPITAWEYCFGVPE
jgi:hypothetical protein